MKSIQLILTIVLALSCTHAFSQSCPVPTPIDQKALLGTWKGSFSQQGEFKSLTIRLESGNSEPVATVSIPSMNQNNQAYQASSCRNHVHLKYNSISGETLEFVVSPNGNSMSGKLTIKKNSDVTEEVFALRKSN